MTKGNDPAMFESGFERNELDAYYTEHDITKAIVRRAPVEIGKVWEPFAGRGDMVRILQDFGSYDVFASDLDASKYDPALGAIEKCDFLSENMPVFTFEEQIDAIITNPPFGKEAELCVRKALSMKDIRFFAFVLRSEWKHGSKRRDLFGNATKGLPAQPYAMEIALQWRPRWDWWYRDKPEASPRHNYSVFCWDRAHVGPPIQQFATRTN